ncbi:acyltransferase family protein [Clavibacter michiganensis]|uniref:acyltransferase family protein n=1 Tax=Clavibacter michiganensis TaxID=28447 RepID=UPI00168097F3|nr:acyltransferase [Clavibacter michiganensis]
MTSVAGQRTGRLELTGLTGIRALAAGWVVVEHFRLVLYGLFPGTEAVLGPWIRSGFLGVEVFFVLSGFIIAYNYADRFAAFSGAGYRAFLELRFARIYPVHLVTLLAMLALVLGARALGVALSADGGYTPLSFAVNLLNAQAVFDLPAWNAPAWSISAEFAAYLAFPLIAIGLVRLRTASAGFVAAGLLVVVGAAAMLAAGALVIDSPTGFLLVWLRIGFEFTAGCCLYAGWRWLDGRRVGWRWDATAALSVLALGVVLGIVGVEGTQPLVTLPVIALFVLACAGATGPVGRLLGSRLLLWGSASPSWPASTRSSSSREGPATTSWRSRPARSSGRSSPGGLGEPPSARSRARVDPVAPDATRAPSAPRGVPPQGLEP